MSGLKFLRNSKGDTIIEVLISIGILSLVLTMAYALSNRNTAYIRQAQERGEAQKLGEKQLELMRGYFETHSTWDTNFKCFNADQPTTSQSLCENINGLYSLNISPTSVPNNDSNTYTITTSWPAITGNTTQTMQLSYKLPPASFDALQFDPASDSYINVAVNKIPRLSTTTSNPTPPCSNAATQPVVGASTTLNYNGPGGGSQTRLTGADGTAQYNNLTEYGNYSASAVAPGQHEICPSPDTADFFPGINPTINLKIRPVCNYVQTHTVPIYNTVWVQDVAIWSSYAVYGWIYQGYFWYPLNPPSWGAGYWIANPPWNTAFENGSTRLEYGEVWPGGAMYRQYGWGVTGWVSYISGWGWRSYQVYAGEQPVFAWVCP